MLDIGGHDTTPPAPGGLELLQRFLNLHRHEPGNPDDLLPDADMLRAFFVERGLLEPDEPFGELEVERTMALFDALHAKVLANGGGPIADADVTVIEEAARRAGLHPHFGTDGPELVPSGEGIDAALGRIVAVAFLSDLNGSWSFLKECASEDCWAVFYDRSKNHSGRWCSMSACGNRAKVRAWRDRQRSETDA